MSKNQHDINPRPLVSEKTFIPALTGIRAVSVYLIFFFHLNPFTGTGWSGWFLFMNQFYAFLSFFFVLSGFLIYYKYHAVASLNRTTVHNYFVNRIARVFPILFILISITFILGYRYGLYTGREAVNLYLLNVSLLKGFSSEYFLTGIGPSWSMSVEELFYLLSPFIFLYVKKLRSLIYFVLAGYAAGLLITWLFSLAPVGGFFSSYLFTAYTTFFGRVYEFACGIFLGMLVSGKITSTGYGWLKKNAGAVGGMLVLLSLVLLYLLAAHFGVEHGYEVWWGVPVNNILLPTGITFIFYSLVYNKSAMQRLLASRIAVLLGNATYSFYLLHTTFVLSFILKYISKNYFIVFLIMVAVSLVFYRLVEQPLATFVRKRFSRRLVQSAD